MEMGDQVEKSLLKFPLPSQAHLPRVQVNCFCFRNMCRQSLGWCQQAVLARDGSAEMKRCWPPFWTSRVHGSCAKSHSSTAALWLREMYSWLDLWMRSWFVLMAHRQYIVSVLTPLHTLKHIDIKHEPWNGLFPFPHNPGSGECCALFGSSLSRCLFLSLSLLLLPSSASSEWSFCNEMVKCILDCPSLSWRVEQSERQSCYPLARLFENDVVFFFYIKHMPVNHHCTLALVINW